ncbi:MAG TPA: 23S rRNA (adenine(2030)-N(6))-methyltransferase RlmJ [Aliidiomarina sp.]|nr:23S rRNA (adenine(2030)-N(6))-methyltransferase RlmJ [Aliidiomarina sp.]
MLSYQHGYHAGNPADIHKHLTLIAVSQYLLKKEAGIHFFDTHAGKGLYDLHDAQAQKRQEYVSGVSETIAHREKLTAADSSAQAWQHYFAELDHLHRGAVSDTNLAKYPGSPHWVSSLRRGHDRHTVFELHPGEHQALAELNNNHTGFVVHGDGLAGVVRMLPAKTPRLLVLIDPAYELPTEYTDVATTVQDILKKSRHAVVLVWYPLLPADKHLEMCEKLTSQLDAPVLQSEWVHKERTSDWGMYGSGVLIVNPPWQLDQQLAELFQPLAKALGKPTEHRLQHFNSSE